MSAFNKLSATKSLSTTSSTSYFSQQMLVLQKKYQNKSSLDCSKALNLGLKRNS